MAASSSSKKQLIPTTLDRRPDLTPQEIKFFQTHATTCSDKLIRKAQLVGGPVQWHLAGRDDTVQIFRGFWPQQDQSKSGATLTCASIQVQGSLDEVIDLFRADTPNQVEDFARRFGKLYTHHVPLYSISMDNNMTPKKAGIVWRTFDNQTLLQRSHKRDACVLECQRQFSTARQRGWVYSTDSVAVGGCPNLYSSLGFVRMSDLGSGYVVRESAARGGWLDVVYLMHLDFKVAPSMFGKSKQQQWFTDMAMKRHVKVLSSLQVYLRENRLSQTPFASAFHRASFHRPAKTCPACTVKKLTSLTKKHQCHKCGLVVCSNCIQDWNVRIKGVPVQVPICAGCSQREVSPAKRSTATTDAPTREFRGIPPVDFNEDQPLFDLANHLQSDAISDVLSDSTAVAGRPLPPSNSPYDLYHIPNLFQAPLAVDDDDDDISETLSSTVVSSCFDEGRALDSIFAADDDRPRPHMSIELLLEVTGATSSRHLFHRNDSTNTDTSSLVDEAAHLNHVLRNCPSEAVYALNKRSPEPMEGTNAAVPAIQRGAHWQLENLDTRQKMLDLVLQTDVDSAPRCRGAPHVTG